MICKIMVPVRGDGKGDNVLAHAAAVATAFGAHVQVVHCHPKLEDMMPFGVVIPSFMRQQIEDAAAQNVDLQEAKLRQEFRDLAAELGLAEQAAERGTATASYTEYLGKQVDAIKNFGRLSDLICVPRPDKSQNLGANSLKTAIYSSARPVLMCPPQETPPARIGSHVAIGWNGSLEATRAMTLAMPFIEAAEQVTILTTGTAPHAASGDALVTYLAQRGVTAQVHRFEPEGGVGRGLLHECEELTADLLVMGAYQDSYERETIFGGNTQAVVDEATLPVILVH